MKKILIVDDNPDIVEALELVLTAEGYDTRSILKGTETFDTIRDYAPDLILLDVLLSGSDGRTICKKLKADEETRNLPVIMISAHPNADKSINDYGADSFIKKPFSINDLVECVAGYIGRPD